MWPRRRRKTCNRTLPRCWRDARCLVYYNPQAMWSVARKLAGKRWAHWVAIVVVFLPPMLAILPMIHFGEGMEDFNVLTAVEIQRDASWMVPTLWGKPRLEKPPCAEWLAAAGLALGGPVEVSARWPLAVVSALTLIVVYEWARLFGGWRAGLVAAVAAGTTLFFIRFTRRAAYDGPLMFWVALTNLALSWILFQHSWHSWHRWRWGTIVAGVALGGALLTKGPPALLHTLLPFAVCCGAAAWWQKRQEGAWPLRWMGKTAAATAIIVVIALAMMLPWVLAIIAKAGGIDAALHQWRVELTLADEMAEKLTTTPAEAMIFFVLLLPWTVWYVGAGVVAWRQPGRLRRVMLFLLVMSFLPIAVHAFMPLVRHRYLLPMLPAAAVAIALAFMDYARRPKKLPADWVGVVAHFALVWGVCAVVPITWALAKADEDASMVRMPWAIVVAAVATAAVALGAWWQRKWAGAAVVTTLVLMLGFQVLYSYSESGRYADAHLAAEQLQRAFPTGQLYCYRGRLDPKAIAIYLPRPVLSVAELSEIPAGGERYLLLQDAGPAVPAGSTKVAEYPTGNKRLRVWKLP